MQVRIRWATTLGGWARAARGETSWNVNIASNANGSRVASTLYRWMNGEQLEIIICQCRMFFLLLRFGINFNTDVQDKKLRDIFVRSQKILRRIVCTLLFGSEDRDVNTERNMKLTLIRNYVWYWMYTGIAVTERNGMSSRCKWRRVDENGNEMKIDANGCAAFDMYCERTMSSNYNSASLSTFFLI